MAKKKILSGLMCLFFTTPLLQVKMTQINSKPKERNIDCVEKVNLRTYEIDQVQEIIDFEIQKRKEIEEEERRRQEEIEQQKINENRIYCKFEVSFYTTSADEGSGTGRGASGEYVIPWVSIALPSDIPFYSTAYIEGLGKFTNMDTGSYIQWSYDEEGSLVCRVDILVNTKEEAFSLGRYYANGYIDIKN